MEYDEYLDVPQEVMDSDRLAYEGTGNPALGETEAGDDAVRKGIRNLAHEESEEGDDAVDNIFYHEHFGVTPASFIMAWWNGCAILYISMNVVGLVHHEDWIFSIIIIWGAGNAVIKWILQSFNE